jgi:hypothetical protein
MKRDKDRCYFFKSDSFLFFFLMLLALGYLCGCNNRDLTFTSEYQAVFLDNSQVFFGKLSDTGSSYLTLRDVYYVQSVVERDKKDPTNILIKRGSEWHNPEFMRINTKHVLVIEPVSSDSRVAQLIREVKAAPPSKSESSEPAPVPKPQSAPPAAAPSAPESKSKTVPPRGR